MRRSILAWPQGAGGGLWRRLPKLLLPALAAVLFGGCASTGQPPHTAAVAPAGAPMPAPASAPAGGAVWLGTAGTVVPDAIPLPRLFSHRLLTPPLQLVQIALGGGIPTPLAAMRRFADAAPPALAQRGLLRARAMLEPEAGWVTLVARAQGVDWVFGIQFTAEDGGLLTLRLRTAGAGNIDDPRPQEMDAHIANLAAVAESLLTD